MKRNTFLLKLVVLVLLFLFGQKQAGAQAVSNIRYKSYSLHGDTLRLDSLSIVPNTLVVRTTGGGIADSTDYTLKSFESLLIWNKKPVGDSVKIFFRVYPFALGAPSYRKDYQAYKAYSSQSVAHPFSMIMDEPKTKLIDFGALDYNGSFSRNLSFGSNQSVVLNSLFNLQLSGMLTKDLEVTAAISDNNIPIQPEGNTQQIQEFDKIFIRLRQEKHQVIVGDFDLNSPADYFLRFTKKYQGGYYTDEFKIKKLGTLRTGLAGGIGRGKFSRNTLVVKEGNQGPYKLTGSAGETFIVILANSEQVFINGIKMERGADRDYVIDYNLGEVTFMPRKIISKDLRVVVEFQYSERNYLRSGILVNTELETKHADVRFNLFSEQDSKGQNIQQDLDAGKKTFLSSIGNNIQNALYPGFDSVAFDRNRILYERIDTLIGGFLPDSVFVYSIDSIKAKYALNFSLVGDGKGDYIPSISTANGRVYQWVSPIFNDSGQLVKQGSYEPVILLVTPKLQQIYTLSGDFRVNKDNVISVSGAMSNYDANTFSKKDNNQNLGGAMKAGYKGTIVTKKDTSGNAGQNVSIDLNYEFVQDRFSPIERFRNVEFNRDWNLGNQVQQFNQHLAEANIGYHWAKAGDITYRFKTFLQDSIYKGYETGLNGNFRSKGFRVSFANSYLNSSTPISNSNFIRPKADFTYSPKAMRGWKVGALYDFEINMLKNKGSDTLGANSFLWQNYKVYAANSDTSVNHYGVEFVMRYEHRPIGLSFDKFFYGAQAVNFTGAINSIKNQTLNYTLTYRHARNNDSLTNSSQPEHFYLGRVDYTFVAVKGVFRSNTLYELGTGRQQKTQIVYQASPTNQGDYVWVDSNKDGIKQINEFQMSPFREDTSYVRLFITTPEFISVNTTQFNEVLQINPAAVWKNKKDFRKVIAMFSVFASIQINKKTASARGNKISGIFNPIPLKNEDSSLVSTTISSSNSLYFNRLDPKYGFQIDYNYSRNRTLLTGGYENRYLQSQGILLRWNIFKSFNAQANYTNGLKANQSDFYSNLKYRFRYNDVYTDLSYQFQTFLRVGARYDFSLKVNPNDSVGKQTARVHKLTISGRYNRVNKSMLDVSLSYASIKYMDKGYRNEQLEYAMLEGLRNGSNLVWNLSFSQNLTDNIQITLGYDGRMVGVQTGDKSTMKPVHTGRAEIRALF
ncbi:MAG: hypothetical protein IPP77_00550 [Bacteroidetes bacterium]|nr:hypothetical protein [Bacteroidota bacterium]